MDRVGCCRARWRRRRRAVEGRRPSDFGRFIERQLTVHAPELFGIVHPLEENALGPYTGLDSADAVVTASSLHVSVVSTATVPSADMIALWRDDENPTHLFVCDEPGGTPSVQRIDLLAPPNANATTIVTGLNAWLPVDHPTRRVRGS